MTTTIDVTDKSRIYFGCAERVLKDILPEKRVVVISDGNLFDAHPQLFAEKEYILIGQGEEAKGLATLDEVYRKLIEMGADRSVFILGIGGGIVTDVAGFVASTYMRGVEFGFITTTLLGAADASVGGKNGVNIGGFKNMVGTFSQPSFVICDVALLATLPDREFRAGLAEVIKSAILGDAELFAMLEQSSFEELHRDCEVLQRVVERTVGIKAAVVAEDEREGGRRRILNLGHTLAHAIEKSTSRYTHGEAVAIGLYHITCSAMAQGVIAEKEGDRIHQLIAKYGFEVELPVEKGTLYEAVKGDKKRSGESIHIILPTAIGCVEDRLVELSRIAEIL